MYGGKKRKKVIKELIFIDCGLGSKSIAILAKLLSDCDAISGLDLSKNLIDVKGGKSLAGIIRSSNVKELQWVKVSPAMSKGSITIPVNDKKVKALDFSDPEQRMGPCEAAMVAGALYTLPNCREIDLSNTTLTNGVRQHDRELGDDKEMVRLKNPDLLIRFLDFLLQNHR